MVRPARAGAGSRSSLFQSWLRQSISSSGGYALGKLPSRAQHAPYGGRSPSNSLPPTGWGETHKYCQRLRGDTCLRREYRPWAEVESCVRPNFSPLLEQRVRAAAGTGRPFVEARVETAADLRQRADQWNAVDGGLPSTLEVLADGGLRIKATAGGAVGPTAVTSSATFYRDVLDGGPSPWIGSVGARVQWYGSAANNSYGQVQAWLHPRFDPTKPKIVQTWILEIFRLVIWHTGYPSFTLTPVVRSTFDARQSGEVAGWVVFTLQDASGKVVPFHPAADGESLNGGTPRGYFVVCSALDGAGQHATNIGWGYDSGNQSFLQGSLPNAVFFQGLARVGALPTDGPPGTWEQTNTQPIGIPSSQMVALQFIPHSFSSTPVTITFKTGAAPGGPLDLGATPPAPPECVLRAETPLGTSVTAAVAADPSGGFEAFTDGQTVAQLSPPIATQRKYDVQVTLQATAAGDRSPILRAV